jgi:transcription elongation factor GreA
MSRDEYAVTPEGLADLKKELNVLQTERLPEIAEKMNLARTKESAALEDNVEYQEALKEWSFMRGRILTLEHVINHAEVVTGANTKKNTVGIGSKVTVRYVDGQVETYHIVGSAEVNPNEGQISNISPVGKSLMGKQPGDAIEIKIPSGKLKLLKITAIN